jgi:hypothetical protein
MEGMRGTGGGGELEEKERYEEGAKFSRAVELWTTECGREGLEATRRDGKSVDCGDFDGRCSPERKANEHGIQEGIERVKGATH